MKRIYVVPKTTVMKGEMSEMMATSMIIDMQREGDAALAPRHNDWNIWGDNSLYD